MKKVIRLPLVGNYRTIALPLVKSKQPKQPPAMKAINDIAWLKHLVRR